MTWSTLRRTLPYRGKMKETDRTHWAIYSGHEIVAHGEARITTYRLSLKDRLTRRFSRWLRWLADNIE